MGGGRTVGGEFYRDMGKNCDRRERWPRGGTVARGRFLISMTEKRRRRREKARYRTHTHPHLLLRRDVNESELPPSGSRHSISLASFPSQLTRARVDPPLRRLAICRAGRSWMGAES